jgi:histidine triad (HIT) family protein
MPNAEPSLFSRIIAGDIPAVHILVVPKTQAYRNVVELADGDPELLAELVTVARTIANEHSNGQFRLVFNTGEDAGQSIFHVHAHVLSGGLTEGSLGSQ